MGTFVVSSAIILRCIYHVYILATDLSRKLHKSYCTSMHCLAMDGIEARHSRPSPFSEGEEIFAIVHLS